MKNKLVQLSEPLAVSMADEWFEIATVDHFWMMWRFKVLKNLLDKFKLLKPDNKFLEIGCGHGQFMRQSDAYLPITIDGCDLNVYALSKIQSTKGKVFVYDITQLHSEMVEKYDGVFLLDVIEHIEDDAAFLSFAKQHSKPGGLVIVNVPALMALYSRYDAAAGHKRRYSTADMEALFNKVGLEKIYIGYWGFLLLPVAMLRKFVLRFTPNESVIDTGFNAGTGGLNQVFKLLMRLELFLIRWAPLGTSVIAVARIKK